MNTHPDSALASIETPRNRCGRIIVVESNGSVGRSLVEQLCADRLSAVLAHTVQHARACARAQPVRALVLGTLDQPSETSDLLEEVRMGSGRPTGDSVWDPQLPTIVLSESDGQLDLLRAFELGADDFIRRTSSHYMELRARLRALLRRAEAAHQMRLLCIGELEIDTDAHLVHFAGAPIALRRLEYELLVQLARNPTRVHSKRELLHTIWDQHAVTGTRTVDSHASRLRRKLHIAGAAGLVVNVWGVGYRLL